MLGLSAQPTRVEAETALSQLRAQTRSQAPRFASTGVGWAHKPSLKSGYVDAGLVSSAHFSARRIADGSAWCHRDFRRSHRGGFNDSAEVVETCFSLFFMGFPPSHPLRSGSGQ